MTNTVKPAGCRIYVEIICEIYLQFICGKYFKAMARIMLNQTELLKNTPIVCFIYNYEKSFLHILVNVTVLIINHILFSSCIVALITPDSQRLWGKKDDFLMLR